jgi:hypothetical protein
LGSDPVPRKHEAGGANVPSPRKISGTYTEGQVVTFKTTLTAFHMGRLGFRVCKIAGNTTADERAQLTETCLDANQLKQADVPGAQAPGDAWYHLGTVNQGSYSTPYQLPAGLTCDGMTSRCVLQFYYLTGNSCTPPGEPRQYTTGATATCGAGAAYPEEFWNCADIVITKAGPGGPSPAASPSPVASPSPSSVASPSPSPSPVPTPTPSGGGDYPCTAGDAACFCAWKAQPGRMFADPKAGCQVRCGRPNAGLNGCPSPPRTQRLCMHPNVHSAQRGVDTMCWVCVPLAELLLVRVQPGGVLQAVRCRPGVQRGAAVLRLAGQRAHLRCPLALALALALAQSLPVALPLALAFAQSLPFALALAQSLPVPVALSFAQALAQPDR